MKPHLLMFLLLCLSLVFACACSTSKNAETTPASPTESVQETTNTNDDDLMLDVLALMGVDTSSMSADESEKIKAEFISEMEKTPACFESIKTLVQCKNQFDPNKFAEMNDKLSNECNISLMGNSTIIDEEGNETTVEEDNSEEWNTYFNCRREIMNQYQYTCDDIEAVMKKCEN